MTEIKKQNVPEEQTLEQAFDTLDGLLEKLEAKETTLEESFLLYQQGMELINRCSRKIRTVEEKVFMMEENGEINEFRSAD